MAEKAVTGGISVCLHGRYPYVYTDGIDLKKNWGGTIESIALLVAIGVNEDGTGK